MLGRRSPAAQAEDVGGVIIECSGLADPRAVVQTFLLDDDLRRRLELREVVAVVDAANVGRHLRMPSSSAKQESKMARLVEEQIAYSSLVLLNKVDRTDGAAQVERLQELIRSVNPTADLLQCTYCDVDPARVLCSGSFKERKPGAWSPGRALIDVERFHLTVDAGAEEAEDRPRENMVGVNIVLA